MPCHSTITVGAITGSPADETVMVLRPRAAGPAPRLVLFHHGHGGDALNAGPSYSLAGPLFAALVHARDEQSALPRYAIVSIDGGGWNAGKTNWANAAGRNALAAAKAWAPAALGLAPGKAAVMGYSMGGFTTGGYVLDHPADVAAWVGLAPGLGDLDANAAGNGQGGAPFGAEIQASWGGNYTANGGPTYNPQRAGYQAALLAAGIRFKAWIGVDDINVDQAGLDTFAAGIGGTVARVAGHHTSFWPNVPVADLLTFLDAGAWA